MIVIHMVAIMEVMIMDMGMGMGMGLISVVLVQHSLGESLIA